ncbi:MAG: glycosyltransferase [Oxalobacteraceae bacterium]|nr:MAG: glycosyltransferase [Oxalobacteraceae bacterium]
MPSRILHNHAVIIASTGRPGVLCDTLSSLSRLTVAPGLVILSVTSAEDLPEQVHRPEIGIVFSARGLPIQRNAGLARLPPEIEFVSFLDDDLELEPSYIETMHSFLVEHREHVIADGAVIRDGDVSRLEARKLIEASWPVSHRFVNSINAYGCNMTVRRRVADIVRFDERLKLYAWLEDADFSRRCLRHGACAQVMNARLVHLRASSGRINGRRFGFAQITNSYYLQTKGQMSAAGLLMSHWGPALCSNALGMATGSAAIDWSGRFRGNLIALRHILAGHCEPEYIEHI